MEPVEFWWAPVSMKFWDILSSSDEDSSSDDSSSDDSSSDDSSSDDSSDESSTDESTTERPESVKPNPDTPTEDPIKAGASKEPNIRELKRKEIFHEIVCFENVWELNANIKHSTQFSAQYSNYYYYHYKDYILQNIKIEYCTNKEYRLFIFAAILKKRTCDLS